MAGVRIGRRAVGIATVVALAVGAPLGGPAAWAGTAGEVVVFAGGSDGPGLGNNGPATSAELAAPAGVVVDPTTGDVFISDSADNEVREVTPAGEIEVLAGTGVPGYYGDGGPAYNAELDDPTGLALDSSGDLFIADTGNDVIREVTAATTSGSDGTITTFAGDGQPGYSGDGGAPTSAALDAPEGVAVGPSDQVAIADTGNSVIRMVQEVGTIIIRRGAVPGPDLLIGQHLEITTVAGTGQADAETGDGGLASSAGLAYPTSVGFDASGDVYISDTSNSTIREINASTGIITAVAHVPYPEGLVVTGTGAIDVADPVQNLIVSVSASGAASVLAGTGVEGDTGNNGPATAATFDDPRAISLDGSGLFIADTGNSEVREVLSGGSAAVVRPAAPAFSLTHAPRRTRAGRGYRARFAVAGGGGGARFSLVGAPAWLAIGAGTGVVAGRVPVGTRSFRFSVSAVVGGGARITAGPFRVRVQAPARR